MQMDFTFGDLYPAMTNLETGNKTNPEAEDQAALNENAEVSEEVSNRSSRPRFIWLALGVIALLVVFFGVK